MEIFHEGGVIICVHSWYKPRVLQADQCGLELLGIEIYDPDQILIFCLYRKKHTVVRHLYRKKMKC